MKKGVIIFILALFCLVISSAVLADGGIVIRDKDAWRLATEEQQLCAINYKDGYQNMILTVDTGTEMSGDEAVWIFPVPAEPEKTAINIIKGFPQFMGYELEREASEASYFMFMAMRLTQIYTIPEILYFGVLSPGNMLSADLRQAGGVTIYETIEKMGLTTELISAKDSQSFTNYLTSKDLELPGEFKSILDGYIGDEYSFVVTWISDIEEFKQEQAKARENEKEYYHRRNAADAGNIISVSITFPTEKIYYPLKPTSVYGSKRVPAIIYVTDYVTPELYPGIEADSEVTYFFDRFHVPREGLTDFFNGQTSIRNLKYTKIKINPPSKFLTEDLWFKESAPVNVKFADFIISFPYIFGPLVFLLCSCLASLLSAIIVFRKDSPSLPKFALFGLFNFLTLLVFSVAAYLLKVSERFTKTKEKSKQRAPSSKVAVITVVAAMIPVIIPSLIIIISNLRWIIDDFFDIMIPLMIFFVIAYPLFCLFLFPIVWGFFNERKTFYFTLLFSALFMVFTIIAQIFFSILV
ncbi:MAG: DUF2330 domain-containing protein [bacterium]|nr:DUF2330 domain-containing protein [bacterium]